MPEKYKTPLQDGIDYKSKVLAAITHSQEVVGLLLDDPNVDLESDETSTALANCLFDFNYIDRTVERQDAFIMVDADMTNVTSQSFNAWELYVQIVCYKEYVPLDPKKFKGVKGNRRDNLTNEVDLLLNGQRLFNVGQIELISATTAVVPDSFTSKMLTYRLIEPRRERYGAKY